MFYPFFFISDIFFMFISVKSSITSSITGEYFLISETKFCSFLRPRIFTE